MPNRKVEANPGDRYYSITLIEELDKRVNPCGMAQRYFSYKCDCGTIKKATLSHIRTGNVKSCGCLIKTRHGLGRTSICNVWRGIKSRCYGKANPKYYSERGISMSDDWRNSFDSFYKWAIENGYKEGLQIDRINTDGNYEESNCRFVTAKENCNNRRKKIKA